MRKNESMTNWPRLIEVTALPTSSTDLQYSCTIGVGWGNGLIPRYGHRSDLRHLSRCYECADRYHAPVPKCQAWTQPQIAKKDIRGVLHDARRNRAEVLFDGGGTLLFGNLIEREQLHFASRKLVRIDPALVEYIIGDNDCRHRILLAGIEREMHDEP